MLRRVFGSKRDEVTGEWRKLHNEELYDLYCSPNIVRVVKSRMRWTEHVARMGERRSVYRVLWERDILGDPGVDGRIILKWIFRKYGLDRPGSGWGQVAGTCECGNETSGYKLLGIS